MAPQDCATPKNATNERHRPGVDDTRIVFQYRSVRLNCSPLNTPLQRDSTLQKKDIPAVTKTREPTTPVLKLS